MFTATQKLARTTLAVVVMETDLVAILKVQARTTTGSGRLFLTYPSYSKVYISRVVFFSSSVPEPEAMAFLVKNKHKSR